MKQKKNKSNGFITKFREYKHITRPVLMWACVLLMVWHIYHIQLYVKQISSPEFAEQFCGKQANLLKGNNVTDINKLINHNPTATDLMQRNVIKIPYNPISEAIWAVVNLCFDLFLIGLLWKGEE